MSNHALTMLACTIFISAVQRKKVLEWCTLITVEIRVEVKVN